jgi:phosphoglycolate phosphatase
MAIRGILFDKDGTIIDYGRTWVPINRQVALFAANGNASLAADLLLVGGHDPATDCVAAGSVLAAGSVAAIASLFAAHLGPRSPPDLAMGIELIFRRGGALHSVLIPGARETIGELARRGFRVGLATNDSLGGLTASLARHGILELFEFHAGCDSGYGAKPDPGMAHAFCEAMGIAPSQLAIVGDAVHDLAMGRAAGVGLNIGVLSGTSAREDLQDHADVVIDSVGEMLTLSAFGPPHPKR